MPSAIDRVNLVIAISTSGKITDLAKKMRLELEGRIGEEYGTFAEVLGAVMWQTVKSAVVVPVPLDHLDATRSVTNVEAGAFDAGAFRVQAVRLRHPGTTLAYRLAPRAGGPSVAYVTDNELGPGGTYDVGPRWYDELVAFVGGADVLIHDAMFDTHEMTQFSGWGHSTAAEAVRLAADAAGERLALFHHRPERDDAGMDALVADARRLAARAAPGLDVVAATEGLQLNL